MDTKEAKEIIRAGFAWANWTEEQREAFKLAYNAIDKAERYEKALKTIMEDSKLENGIHGKVSYSYPGKIAKKALEA